MPSPTPSDHRVPVALTVHQQSRALEIEWRGAGLDEKGYEAGTDRCLVEVDPRYFRPTEVDLLLGDASKAKDKLGWTHTVTARELASEMVQADLKVMTSDTVMKEA